MNETLAKASFAYSPFSYPSFTLPPPDLSQLRIIHGSCRKPHGEGRDALSALDKIIDEEMKTPDSDRKRPHLLLLTGDQIYADDVADALLWLIIDAAHLMNLDEPLKKRDRTILKLTRLDDLKLELRPGHRAKLAESEGGLTASIPDKPETAKSHLLFFSEFCLMYLFAWSDVLWPASLPDFSTVHKTTPPKHITKDSYDKEIDRLNCFKSTLGNVRRALANIPTYMIFDDHEITDDWYYDLKWCKKVLGSHLGSSVVANGLLAYAFFQAWGNTPEQFNGDNPGGKLIQAIVHAQADSLSSAELEPLGVPPLGDLTRTAPPALSHAGGQMNWHFTINGPTDAARGAPIFVIVALDSRTWRCFPGAEDDPPELISQAGLGTQFEEALPPAQDGVMIVIAPSPVFGLALVEGVIQGSQHEYAKRLDLDVELWSEPRTALERLLSALACVSRVSANNVTFRSVVLSGDVHYSFCGRIRYTANEPFGVLNGGARYEGAIAQLTASSLKNEIFKTRALNYVGSAAQQWFDIPLWIGWNNSTKIEFAVPTRIEPGPFRWVPAQVSRYPFVTGVEDAAKIRVARAPDWKYSIEYVSGEADKIIHERVHGVMYGELLDYERFSRVHSEAGPSTHIVGCNSIGDLTFDWDAVKVAIQRYHWSSATNSAPHLDNYLHIDRACTTFIISLDFSDVLMPIKTIPSM